MMSPDTKRQPQFEIDASVVYELGEKLISDEVQALVELVKNSYDADATYVSITVEAEKLVKNHSRRFPKSRGYIIVEDDGQGMSRRDIEKGWLTLSASPKREMKQRGERTSKGRTPLGDKGLGRLGSQRLGQRIEIWTSQSNSRVEYYVGIDWGDFRGRVLSQVPIHFDDKLRAEKSYHGTRIVISGLRAPERWQGANRDKLVGKLAQLLFPFEELRPFDVFLTVNGTRVDLDRISARVFDVADARFEFSFDGKKLHIEGKYRLGILLAALKGEHARQQFQNLVAQDQGADFYIYLSETYLSQEGARSIPGLKWEDEPGWFVSFAQDFSLDDIGDIELVTASPLGQSSSVGQEGEFANPGPFHGAIYTFKRKGTDLSAIGDVFNLQSEFSKYIEKHSGVRVFRNGFGIRPFGVDGNDWLQLGRGQTSGRSYYGLRPKNVIGYVALTAQDNSQLEEATDREGFVDNAYARNFHRVMLKVAETIALTNENLRRGYNEYTRTMAAQEAGFVSRDTPEIFDQMRDTSAASKELEARVSQIRDELQAVYTQVAASVQDIESTPLLHTEQEREIAPLLREIRQTLDAARYILEQVEEALSQAKKLGAIADVLEPDLEHLREELSMFSELAGLGIVAEALSHEMSIVADGLASRTRALLQKLKGRQAVDQRVVAYTEHVYTAVGQMRKQLSHLDPSLRYVRERRDNIEMRAFWRDMQEFYADRLGRSNIEMVLQEPFSDFVISMNKGKLTQVVDNIILNAEYWLKEDLRKRRISTAQIIVRTPSTAPIVDIYDTGRGVAPSVEQYLFQPFVTMKPEGRGLGLFIARQLLDSSGCLISLLPERNQFDRRYIFRLDLTGASIDERE